MNTGKLKVQVVTTCIYRSIINIALHVILLDNQSTGDLQKKKQKKNGRFSMQTLQNCSIVVQTLQSCNIDIL